MEADVPSPVRNLYDDRERLLRRAVAGGTHRVVCIAPRGPEGSSLIANARLLVGDLDTSDPSAGSFGERAHGPILHVSGDVHPLDLGIDRRPAAGPLLE